MIKKDAATGKKTWREVKAIPRNSLVALPSGGPVLRSAAVGIDWTRQATSGFIK
jgi:hypothetical protein